MNEVIGAGVVALFGCGLLAAMIQISHLKETNAAQKKKIKALKEECNRWKSLAPGIGANPTALRMTIFYQREQIEALEQKVAHQKQLLAQKWKEAHTASEGGGTDGR